MLRPTGRLHLGVILCKHCNHSIDTLDTDNVIIYYSECKQTDCVTQRSAEGVIVNEG